MEVRDMTVADWDDVRAVYAAGIATGDATFEVEPPTWERFDAAHGPDLRLVAVRDGVVVGWAAAGPVSDRPAYAGAAEHSVYVAPTAWGQGVGRRLLEALVARAEARGIWTLQSGIFPENVASLALHRRCGFRVLGVRERIGRRDGRWRDVVWVERRSPVVGL